MKDLATLRQVYTSAKTRAWGFVALKHVTAPLIVASDAYIKALEARVHQLETGALDAQNPLEVMRAEFAEDNTALECLVSCWQAYTSHGNPIKWADMRGRESAPFLRKWRLIEKSEWGEYNLTERGIAYVKCEYDKLAKEMNWTNAYSSDVPK